MTPKKNKGYELKLPFISESKKKLATTFQPEVIVKDIASPFKGSLIPFIERMSLRNMKK